MTREHVQRRVARGSAYAYILSPSLKCSSMDLFPFSPLLLSLSLSLSSASNHTESNASMGWCSILQPFQKLAEHYRILLVAYMRESQKQVTSL